MADKNDKFVEVNKIKVINENLAILTEAMAEVERIHIEVRLEMAAQMT